MCSQHNNNTVSDAGDAFRAGFAVGLVHGWPLQHCMQFAAAAGALAVSRKGALPSLPSFDDVLNHLQAHTDIVAPELLDRLKGELVESVGLVGERVGFE